MEQAVGNFGLNSVQFQNHETKTQPVLRINNKVESKSQLTPPKKLDHSSQQSKMEFELAGPELTSLNFDFGTPNQKKEEYLNALSLKEESTKKPVEDDSFEDFADAEPEQTQSIQNSKDLFESSQN